MLNIIGTVLQPSEDILLFIFPNRKFNTLSDIHNWLGLAFQPLSRDVINWLANVSFANLSCGQGKTRLYVTVVLVLQRWHERNATPWQFVIAVSSWTGVSMECMSTVYRLLCGNLDRGVSEV